MTLPIKSSLEWTAKSGAPADPGVGLLAQSVMKYCGMPVLAARPGQGLWRPLQSLIGRNNPALWLPAGNSATAPGVAGTPAATVLGTATSRTVATTSKATRARRMGYVSAATAAAFAGHYYTVSQYTIGTGTDGGFLYVCRFVNSNAAAVSGERRCIGLRNGGAAPTNVEPSSIKNHISLAQLSTSDNLQLCYGGSTAQTPIDLGVNFPANTLSADIYELVLYSPCLAANQVFYRVERLNTGDIAEGQITNSTPGTTLPANTTLLNHWAWTCNNATLLAVGLDIAGWMIEPQDF